MFLRGEQDAWAACDDEKAAQEAAEGEFAKECEISAELRQKCSALATEAREAREKVAPWRRGSTTLPWNPKNRVPPPRGTRARLLGWKLCSLRKTSSLTKLRLTSLRLRVRSCTGIGARRRMGSVPRVRTESFTLAL